jgi:hypothetical protein
MSWNLLSEVKAKVLYRVDVDFQLQTKTMQSWLGRTAHIKLLECQPFLKMLVVRYRDLFE